MAVQRQPLSSYLKRNRKTGGAEPLTLEKVIEPFREVLVAIDMECEQRPADHDLDRQRRDMRNYMCGVVDHMRMDVDVFNHYAETLGEHEREIVKQARRETTQLLYRRLAAENAVSLSTVAEGCKDHPEIVLACRAGIQEYNVMLAPQQNTQQRLM